MKSIAGSIVVLGACVLAAVSVLCPLGDRAAYGAIGAALICLLGLIITFGGSRDGT